MVVRKSTHSLMVISEGQANQRTTVNQRQNAEQEITERRTEYNNLGEATFFIL